MQENKTYVVSCTKENYDRVFEMFRSMLEPVLLKALKSGKYLATTVGTQVHFVITNLAIIHGVDIDDYIVIDPTNADKKFIDSLNMCKIGKEIRSKK